MLAVCLMFGAATLVSAQERDSTAANGQTQSTQDQDRQQISISDLPDAVTAKLESQDYSGWTIGNAYKKTDASQDNTEVYIVELKKGTELKNVKFDKDGNEVNRDANEMDDNQGQHHDQGQLKPEPEKQ